MQVNEAHLPVNHSYQPGTKRMDKCPSVPLQTNLYLGGPIFSPTRIVGRPLIRRPKYPLGSVNLMLFYLCFGSCDNNRRIVHWKLWSKMDNTHLKSWARLFILEAVKRPRLGFFMHKNVHLSCMTPFLVKYVKSYLT